MRSWYRHAREKGKRGRFPFSVIQNGAEFGFFAKKGKRPLFALVNKLKSTKWGELRLAPSFCQQLASGSAKWRSADPLGVGCRGVHNTMVTALARAFRWRKLLETGVFATVEEIAAAEIINAFYVGRVLRLALLAPDLVEAILDGWQPAQMTLALLMRPFAAEWAEQRRITPYSIDRSDWYPPGRQLFSEQV